MVLPLAKRKPLAEFNLTEFERKTIQNWAGSWVRVGSGTPGKQLDGRLIDRQKESNA